MDHNQYKALREKMIVERRESLYTKLYESGCDTNEVAVLINKISKCNKILFDLKMERTKTSFVQHPGKE